MSSTSTRVTFHSVSFTSLVDVITLSLLLLLQVKSLYFPDGRALDDGLALNVVSVCFSVGVFICVYHFDVLEGCLDHD